MNDTLTLNPRGFTAMSHDEMMAVDGGNFLLGLVVIAASAVVFFVAAPVAIAAVGVAAKAVVAGNAVAAGAAIGKAAVATASAATGVIGAVQGTQLGTRP
jgi:hypothetical protein